MTHWRPSSTSDVAHRRADMMARIRQYFADRQVLAVDTPALSAFATSDPNIENIEVRGKSRRFLHTSPESSMKCLLAAGYPDIYSISRVFRGSESGQRHLPEFTLLEWYRLGFQLPDIIADTTALIGDCLERDELRVATAVVDYSQAIAEHSGLDAQTATSAEIADVLAADNSLRQSLGEDRHAWLDLLLVDKVVPNFAPNRLTVLQHYPVAQGALARVCPGNPNVADRFEVFYGTLELANGYVELNDPDEQRHRFEQDLVNREKSGLAPAPVDELLLAALEHGLPQCAGVAVGFERLHMVFEKTDNIADVVTFAERQGLERA